MKLALVSIALLVPMVFLLATAPGRQLDQDLVHAARSLDRSVLPVHLFMQLGTAIGDHRPLMIGALTTAAFGTPAARATAGVAFVAVAANQTVTGAIKTIVNRTRPDKLHSPRANSSFPSGHTSAAIGLAYVVAHRHRRWTAWAWAIAVWISISRIFLERHYPSDVLGGALVGLLVTALVLRFEEQLSRLTTRGQGQPRPAHRGR